jgi:hypothetical protein
MLPKYALNAAARDAQTRVATPKSLGKKGMLQSILDGARIHI